MRTTTFFLLFFLISLLFNSCYNKSVINKKRVVLKACNQPSSIKTWKKYKINKVDSQRYFTYEKNIVYMDYDIEPIFKDTLVKYFADRIELSDMGFSIEILFLIGLDGLRVAQTNGHALFFHLVKFEPLYVVGFSFKICFFLKILHFRSFFDFFETILIKL